MQKGDILIFLNLSNKVNFFFKMFFLILYLFLKYLQFGYLIKYSILVLYFILNMQVIDKVFSFYFMLVKILIV